MAALRSPARALRFDGWIAGIGTASGTRVVLGHWPVSPFGPFSDLMVEEPDGHRLLLAPSRETADFVSGIYLFDEVRVVPVRVRITGRRHWAVSAPPLDLRFSTGPRTWPGRALRAVPGRLATSPGWLALWDRPARLLLGAGTHGSVRSGRHQWYGARDLHPVTSATVTREGRDLGALALVEPPVRFGSGSTPRRPCLVRVTTRVTTRVALAEDRSTTGAPW
ncbi:hypothetical protein ACIPM2_07695 [Streptomyces sp. NPDC086081]|uniref:hypothetical protein n=1 Tax=unclassified Streptomyces TaxID=2593676 RepID=UPI0034279033